MDYDIAVIGSGPGGYVTAIRAAQLGLSAAVVEMASDLGGTCLHVGCIPTKALLHTAEALDNARQASRLGVEVGDIQLDIEQMHRHKDKTIRSNTKGIELLLRKNGIDRLSGRGRLVGPGKVKVHPDAGEAFNVESKNVVLATGSVIRDIPAFPCDGTRIINSDDALSLKHMPESLIVLGAGAVGVEFASMFASFGVEVSLVELLPHVLPLEDKEISGELEKAFKRRGINIYTGANVEDVLATDRNVRLQVTADGSSFKLEAEKLLVAVGRSPLTGDLGLETVGVQPENGFIPVNDHMQTSQPGVYAVGDIVKSPALAHVASYEGVVAAEDAAGAEPRAIDYDKVPSCTYCRPEVASIGLTEKEARNRGLQIQIGKFPFAASGKAKVLNETGGFIKIIADEKYDELLGVHIIGPQATELIGEAIIALELESSATSLFQAMHAHPTLAESMAEAALAIHNRTINF